MKLAPYARAYRQNSVQTASPGQLILMLFDGALRFMGNALCGFELEDVIERNETVHLNLVKTQAIIDELQSCLDLKAGGEFARGVSDLYDFMRGQLRQANVGKNPKPVTAVMELLGDIRGAWSTMIDQRGDRTPAPTAMVATAV